MTLRSLQKLVNELTKLPGVGEKTATRYALYILNQDISYAKDLADAIINFKKNLKKCKVCGSLSEEDICSICSDKERDQNIICIVEDSKDILTIENTHSYFGVYHVLNGVLNPLNGITPDKLNIKALLDRIDKNKDVEEVILALNSSIEGQTTALYLKRLFQNLNIKVTKIANGIPLGTSIEFSDVATLSQAIKGRVEI